MRSHAHAHGHVPIYWYVPVLYNSSIRYNHFFAWWLPRTCSLLLAVQMYKYVQQYQVRGRVCVSVPMYSNLEQQIMIYLCTGLDHLLPGT